MRSFRCDVCGRLLVFENSVCVTCGTAQGFDATRRRIVPLPPASRAVTCANRDIAGCNWLPGTAGGRCLCCQLTRTRPSDADGEGLLAFGRAEAAKRRMVYQLLDLALPVVPLALDADRGLEFDLLSSARAPVLTGPPGCRSATR